jgi:hypothetical protein
VDWVEKLVAGNGSWFSLILAFAILPSFYLKFAFDMQKEYVELAKTTFSNPALTSRDREKLVQSSEEALHVFQVEWGMILAIAILILANFSSVFIVDLSSFGNGCIGSPGKVTSTLVWEAAAPHGAVRQPRIVCEKVKNLLSIYSVLAVLLMFFQIWWSKLTAIKRLRRIYLELSLLGRKDRTKPVERSVRVLRPYNREFR